VIEEHLRSFGANQPLITADAADLNILHIASGIDSNRSNEVLESLKFILQYPEVEVNAFSGAGNEQWTAAHIATSWGWSRSLDLLLKHGADPYICDSNGLNVWDIARDYDNYDCVRVLESRMSRTNEDTILVLDDEDDDRHSVFSNESATELTHFDRKFGLAFVEDKVPHAPGPDSIAHTSATAIDESICALDDSSLRRRLIESGESPGPVVKTTREFYKRRLQRLISATSSKRIAASPVGENITSNEETESPESRPCVLLPAHPAEVNRLIDGKFNFAEGRRLEKELIQFFAPDGSKSYFNYLLIDPRISLGQGRPSLVPGVDTKFDPTKFLTFLKGIFYVGKGHGKRPLMHLYEAAFQSRGRSSKKTSSKCDRILEIWKEEWGVISLHCFQNISSQEALARECLIIEALGLNNLTNIQIGQNKVKLLRWTESKRRTAGAFLLFKAYWIFCIEGQSQIRMGDVRF
jgi:hypothetical protein